MKKYIVAAVLFALLSLSLKAQWERQNLPAGIGMVLTTDFVDSSYGCAGGWEMASTFEGRMIFTTNGGYEWQVSSIPSDTRSLVKVQAFTATTAYAFGAKNTAGKVNNYETYKLTTLLTKNPLIAREFANSAQSIDESYAGLFLTSKDGGNEWTSKETLPGDIKYVVSASFTNEFIGYILGDSENMGGAGIYKTSDGGDNWTTQIRPDTNLFLRKIKFTCLNTGIAVGWKTDSNFIVNGIIYNTADGGATWNINEFPDVDNFTDIVYTNDETAYAVGISKSAQGVIFQTVDRGFTWRELSNTPDITFIDAVGFVLDTQTGIITGSNPNSPPQIFITEDGGENWGSQNLPSDLIGNILFSIEMPFPDYWFISGGNMNNGLMLHTKNGGITSTDADKFTPNEFSLSQNYPNPFNPTTKINFTIATPPRPSPYQGEGLFVNLTVYDVTGQLVNVLLNEPKQPGIYEVEFNAADLPSGIYFYKLNFGNLFSETKKMLLIK